MTPESEILAALDNNDFWIEKFPEGNTTSYPKGLIKRISSPAIKHKGVLTSGYFKSRINILWFAPDTSTFNTKLAEINSAMWGLLSESKIHMVDYQDAETNGYDPITDMHVLSIEYIIKHEL